MAPDSTEGKSVKPKLMPKHAQTSPIKDFAAGKANGSSLHPAPKSVQPQAQQTFSNGHCTPPNPFEPNRLRLSQDFVGGAPVKKVLTTISCRKPARHEWVRVRLGEDWRLETALFEDKINRESYLVDRPLWQELLNDIFPVCLFFAITRQNDVMLWPCKLPGHDGRSNTWNESALAAARLAETQWTRMSANLAAGMYDTYEARSTLAEPEWPELSFQEVLTLCFKNRFITSLDHPAIKTLRGEL